MNDPRIGRLVILSLWLALGALRPPAALAQERPNFNVLLVTVDTLRYDRVGVLDSRHVRTPRMDGLARASLSFTRAFAHNPVTLASHANILTGATPLLHGISDNTGFKLGGRFLTIPEHLRRHSRCSAQSILPHLPTLQSSAGWQVPQDQSRARGSGKQSAAPRHRREGQARQVHHHCQERIHGAARGGIGAPGKPRQEVKF